MPVLQAYGMTEASHQMARTRCRRASGAPGRSASRPGSRSAVARRDWRPVAAGEVGEVAVRGASVIDGYRDNPAANAASFRDGWFRTGDSGTLSPTATSTLTAGSRS